MIRAPQRVVFGIVLLGACAQAGTDARPGPGASPSGGPWRQKPPDSGPQPDLQAPVVSRQQLANGLTVLTSTRGVLPLVHARIVVRAGAARDPEPLPGLAGFLAEMLKTGTASRSAEQIALEIETLGSSLYTGVGEDSIAVSFTAQKKHFAAVLDVVADVVMHPAFAADELERVRRRRLAQLAEERDDPRRLADRVFRRVVFGGHPYAHTTLGTTEAVHTIDRAALQGFYGSAFGPRNTAVVVVGALESDEAVAAVSARFGAWAGEAGTRPALPAPQSRAARLTLVDKKNAPQSQLRVGHLGVPRDHSDYFGIVMLNAVLGGMFNSRINMNLREDKGYTYGARTTFAFLRAGGYFGVLTAVSTEATAPALIEIFREIELIRRAGVTENELLAAKNSYTLSLPGYFQTVEGVGGMVSNLFLFDLPLDYYQHLPQKIRAVTSEDLLRVANEHLWPDKLTVTVVGDELRIRAGLEALHRGEIHRLTADGEMIP